MRMDDYNLSEMSDAYYEKDVLGTICQYRPGLVSDLIGLERMPVVECCERLDEPPRWILNNPFRLTDIIRRKERTVTYVSEGLIKTFPKDKLAKRYSKYCMDHLPAELNSLRVSDVYAGYRGKPNVKIADYAYFNEPDEEVSSLVRFMFATYSTGDVKMDSDKAKSFIDGLIEELYWCGYNFSNLRRISDGNVNQVFSDDGERRRINLYAVQFEAKFSDHDAVLGDNLYHVTPRRYMEKIRRRGLVPSAKSPVFKYPERVYLFNFPEDMTWEKMERVMKSYMRQRFDALMSKKVDATVMDRELDGGFYVLKIDADAIRRSDQFKSGALEFQIDACYDGMAGKLNDSPAIFTYNNVPRNVIEDKVLFYPLEEFNGGRSKFGEPETMML